MADIVYHMTQEEFVERYKTALNEWAEAEKEFIEAAEKFRRKLSDADDKMRILHYEAIHNESSINQKTLPYMQGRMQAVRSNVGIIGNLVNPF